MAWSDLAERIGPWRNGALLVLLIGSLVLAFQFPEIRPSVAAAVALGMPVVIVILGALRVADAGRLVLIGWLLVGGAAAAIGDVAAARALFPDAPWDRVRLQADAPEGRLSVPEGTRHLIVEVRGRARSSGGDAEGSYEIQLSGVGGAVAVEGRISRVIRSASGRRTSPSRSVELHETELHHVALPSPSPGQIELRLAEVEGLRHDRVDVAARPNLLPGVPELGALVLLALAAAFLEVRAARAHAWTPLTAALGVAAALGLYVALRIDPDSPLVTVIAAILVSIVAAGGAGLLIGVAAVWLFRPRSASPPADG